MRLVNLHFSIAFLWTTNLKFTVRPGILRNTKGIRLVTYSAYYTVIPGFDSVLWKLALAMASSSFDFDRALAYALSCVKQEGLSLKDQQVEAVKLLSEGKTVFVWFFTGYGKSICYQLLPFVFDVKLGRTNAPLVDRSVVLVISPLVSDSTRILLSASFIRIFIELYNCFTERFTVEFTIATDTPIYNQYLDVIFSPAVYIRKYRPGDEATTDRDDGIIDVYVQRRRLQRLNRV